MSEESKIEFYGYLEKLENETKDLNLKMGIYSNSFPEKKKKSCDDAVLSAVLESKMDLENFKYCKSLIYNKKALDLSFFFSNQQNSTLWDFMHDDIITFAKALFKKTPKGFGTPNAAPGEGELMFCILHPDIIKPTKGDLCIIREYKEHIFELKGDQPRVQTNVLGIDFSKETLSIAQRYNITPNTCRAKTECAVELEKDSYKKHYCRELNKLSFDKRKDFIWEWLQATGGIFTDKEQVLKSILEQDGYNLENLKKEIIKGFFRYMCANEDFRSLILLGKGTNIKIIPNNPDFFDRMVDEGQIEIKSDYFRVAQYYGLGWYIS